MEELIRIIQQDPELWEIVENLKHPDQEPMEFFEIVANMFELEFEELHRTDLDRLFFLFQYQSFNCLLELPTANPTFQLQNPFSNSFCG